MACQCAPALLQLRDELNRRWPKRDKASDGCCASAKHSKQNPSSDHEPGAKGATEGYAHAYDIDEDLDADIHSLAWLKPILLADSRCKYVIYEKRIAYPDGTDKPYSGSNPHDKHLHVSIKPTSTFETRSWLGALDKPSPPKEAEMTSPAVVSHAGKRWTFVHGTDGHLWGSDESTWFDLDGTLAPGSSPAATEHDGGIDVVVTGDDARVWGRSLRGGEWSPWWGVPGDHKVG